MNPQPNVPSTPDYGTAVVRKTKEGVLVLPEAQAISAIYKRTSHRRSLSEDVAFLSQWISLLESGTPLAQSLRRVSTEAKDKSLGASLLMLADGLEQGYGLKALLETYPQIFPRAWSACILAGVHDGNLTEALRFLCGNLAEENRRKPLFDEAVTAPIQMVVALIMMIGAIFLWVLPTVSGFMAQLGWVLPSFLVGYMSIARSAWNVLMIAGCLGVAGYWMMKLTEGGQFTLGKLRFRLPIFGLFMRRYEELRVLTALKFMDQSRMSYGEGLKFLGDLTDNLYVRESLYDAARKIRQGYTLKQAIKFVPVLSFLSYERISEAVKAQNMVGDQLDVYMEEQLNEGIVEQAQGTSQRLTRQVMMVSAVGLAWILVRFYWHFLTTF